MKEITIEYINKSIELLEKVHKQIHGNKDGTLVAFALLSNGIIDSSKTISTLIASNRLRDAYIISRPIFEHCLNIGYFSVMGEEMIEKAYNHSLSKTYRDLRRKVEIGDIKFSIGLSEEIKVDVHDRLENALKEFTNKKGHEIRSWSSDNTFRKIKLITEKYGKGIGFPFSLCLYYIYRHSSEIIHGSIFGAMFSLGMTQERSEWPESKEEFDEYYNHRLTLLGQSIILLISSTIHIIGNHSDIDEIEEENKTLVSKFRKEMKTGTNNI